MSKIEDGVAQDATYHTEGALKDSPHERAVPLFGKAVDDEVSITNCDRTNRPMSRPKIITLRWYPAVEKELRTATRNVEGNKGKCLSVHPVGMVLQNGMQALQWSFSCVTFTARS